MYQFWNHIIRPLLLGLHPKKIIEVGVGTGKTTELLLALAKDLKAELYAIDTVVQCDTEKFAKDYSTTFHFHLGRSIDILPTISDYDVVLIDGDHNYFTVSAELEIIQAKAKRTGIFPTIFIHDVNWPYARRDCYYDTASIPEKDLHPQLRGGVLPQKNIPVPEGGLNPDMVHAVHEGGPKNGVLTAVEDFLLKHPGLKWRQICGCFGLGILYDSAHAVNIESVVDAFDHPQVSALLGTVEKDRVRVLLELSASNFAYKEIWKAAMEHKKLQQHFYEEMQRLTEDRARLLQTLSWRMTKPLRSLYSFLRALRRSPGRVWPIRPTTLLRSSAPQLRGGNTVPVSVIITARNAMPYLRECLRSIVDQTVVPLEILYMDDGSTDSSVACAKEFPRVRVISHSHQGVTVARNAAFEQTSGEFLLFVDGDDILTPSYIQDHLVALQKNPHAGFSYGPVTMFGTTNRTFHPPDWSLEHLWFRNFVCSSSMIRRGAFESVGGWRDTVGTLWDWDLFLRISRLYPGAPSTARLLYRRHETSWSMTHEGQLDEKSLALLHGRFRRNACAISLCTVYGGRLPELLPLWSESIAKSIQEYKETPSSIELLILDTSERGDEALIRKAFAPHQQRFSRLTVIHRPEPLQFSSEVERRHKVCQMLARAYTTLLTLAEGDIVWFIEDDVVVPSHAFSRLLMSLTDGVYDESCTLPPKTTSTIPAAVSALYRSRHTDEWIAHHVHGGVPSTADPRGTSPFPIHLAGTGCLMVWKPCMPPICTPYWRGEGTAHDWAWSDALRAKGYEILLDPFVRCRHYLDASKFV